MADEASDQINKKFARGLELLVRLQIDQIKGNRNQTDMIRHLAGLGVTSAEIASFLGVPSTTVQPIVSKAKKPAKATRRKKR